MDKNPQESKIPPKPVQREGLFGKKQSLSREELRREFLRAGSSVPGGGMFSSRERVKMEKELFPERKYGGQVSKMEYSKRLRGLGMEKYKARTDAERIKIDRQIRFLKKMGGV
jgi:hypothetical protein